MALPPNYPNLEDESVALGIVRRYVKKGTDDELIEQLNETQAQDAAGTWFYRPYLVAYRALKSNPRWLVKGQSGRANGEWRDLSHALEALASQQAEQDAALGLDAPAVVQPRSRPLVSQLVY